MAQKPLAWVKEQNAKSLGVLKADPDYQKDYDSILAVLDATDRIPFGGLDHQYVFNFWQDADHHKGIWRRTTIADYANPQPKWETILDIDKLAADEHENWVFKGAECNASDLRAASSRCRRGGGDAVVVREFDLATKTFVKDGFTLPEAKSQHASSTHDTVCSCTDFGTGSLTTSGYPRIVKIWKRGTPIADCENIARRQARRRRRFDRSSCTARRVDRRIVQRSVSFFETRIFPASVRTARLAEDRRCRCRPGRAGRCRHGRLLVTLRDDWTPPGAHAPIPKGALIAVPIGAESVATVDVLYAPGPRDFDRAGRRPAAMPSMPRSTRTSSAKCTRSVSIPRRTHGATRRSRCPPGGSVNIVSTNDFGPEAEFRFESFLTPTTLYADAGDDKPVAIKSLPPRFDASNLTSEQFEATSKDGTKIPYFVTRPKDAERPDADRALRLWRLRSFDDARLFGEFRTAVAVEGRHLCARQHPRRRRVRAGLASGGAEGKPPERL